ncbi:DNA repair protein RecO [Paucibacter sp. DJ2R-2]|uniref:DNA repair protein RecO n=1 Tax=Paucibacter sp. DJ2R-2 TaxID=2893558 RepID=UPI0021E43DA5|nr:DNA repair protein RecO [Paucibacter sp. DJ2R-2]MCV2423074.1 DNA repair protein RecO [Paucibacter sp. DJ4R-1]MCV2440970.1 DNA repair protein RecO [Paucibacter sp. DJ2R-2]
MARSTRTPAVQQAFVLHQYDWSESSLILDLFTREQGRLAVVAKGAKRPYSQLRAVLLPFQRIQVTLSKPAKSTDGHPAEVVTLRAAEWAGGSTLPAGAALFSGYYLNELLLKLLARQDAHPQLFDAYAQTLPQLHANEDAQSQAALRAFELRLLVETGLLPDLSVVTLTQAALQLERSYGLTAEAGVQPAPTEAGGLEGATLIHLQAALLHGSMAALQQACAPVLPQLKSTLRGLLHYHLGGKPLRTRQVMLDVQKLLD